MLGGRRVSSGPGRAGLLGETPCSLVWGLRQGLGVPTVPAEGRRPCATPDGRPPLTSSPLGHPCLALTGPSPPRWVRTAAAGTAGRGQAPSPDADGHFVDGTDNIRFR